MDENSINTPSTSKQDSCNEESSSKPSISSQISGKRVEPLFRIVTSYDKRNRPIEGNPKGISKHVKTISEEESRKKGDLYTDVQGPVWHTITNAMLTRPIIGGNLPLQFKDLPIFGAPESPMQLEQYQNEKIREFVGVELDDVEFQELADYCNPDNLKTGKEIQMLTNYPITGLMTRNMVKKKNVKDDSDDEISEEEEEEETESDLCVVNRAKERKVLDTQNTYKKILKYRGVKQFPLNAQENSTPSLEYEPPDLEPGKDVLYRVRVFRPFTFQLTGEKHVRGRHSVFDCDIVVLGRQPLTALRDRIPCRNDIDMRIDKTENPDVPASASARTLFPSGFMFINNVFYVDGRAGCHDTSAVVRRWAAARDLGDFPVRSMDTALNDTVVRLAHPEVYIHQGNCEHLFLFSEIRLLNTNDPLHLSTYPCHTVISQNQSIYCTTCAEYGAKWLVTGSNRVPFDPAFFCDLCYNYYLYKGNKKIGEFRAYAYKGNELNDKNPAGSHLSK